MERTQRPCRDPAPRSRRIPGCDAVEERVKGLDTVLPSGSAAAGCCTLGCMAKAVRVGYLPLHPGTPELVTDYLEAAGHGGEMEGALFRPVRNNVSGTVEGAMTADGIYKIVKYYASVWG